MKKIMLFIFLSLSSWTAFADPKMCQVEILVFQNNMQHAQIPDNGREVVQAASITESIIPQPFTDSNPRNRLLAKNALSLTAEHKRLAQNHRYTVLLHLGWTQPIVSSATPIHIYAQSPQPISAVGELEDYNPETPMMLDGTVTISQAKKMRTKVDFVLNTGDARIRMHQQAFLSLGELYYFDHQHYGALVRITPI